MRSALFASQRPSSHAPAGAERTGGPLPVAAGTIADISPQVLALETGERVDRFTMAATTTAWRGGRVQPAALRPGDRAIVRLTPGRRNVAERIWAQAGRVTGTILELDRGSMTIDEGVTRPRQAVIIRPGAMSRIQVRFPRLEPGQLLDVIGLRHDGFLEGIIPATYQPSYWSGRGATGPSSRRRVTQGALTGSVTWHEPAGAADGAEGVAYPAIDPSSGCLAGAAPGGGGCGRLPYLAVGSRLLIRNECSHRSQVLPVTGCAAAAQLFCDRCVTCGTSPRGRISDLTMSSFVALGGELEQGCFNAAVSVAA